MLFVSLKVAKWLVRRSEKVPIDARKFAHAAVADHSQSDWCRQLISMYAGGPHDGDRLDWASLAHAAALSICPYSNASLGPTASILKAMAG
jgi:hypothetical protein